MDWILAFLHSLQNFPLSPIVPTITYSLSLPASLSLTSSLGAGGKHLLIVSINKRIEITLWLVLFTPQTRSESSMRRASLIMRTTEVMMIFDLCHPQSHRCCGCCIWIHQTRARYRSCCRRHQGKIRAVMELFTCPTDRTIHRGQISCLLLLLLGNKYFMQCTVCRWLAYFSCRLQNFT